MTGSIEHSEGQPETVVVKIPQSHTVFLRTTAGLVSILLVAVAGLLIYMWGFKASWEEAGGYKAKVEANTEFRLTQSQNIADNTAFRKVGDRVTPEDLSDASKSFADSLDTTNGLILEFIKTNSDNNALLVEIASSVRGLEAKLESAEKERDRLQKEIDRVKNIGGG